MRNRSQSLSALMVVLWLSASTSGILFAEPADSSLPEKLDSILSEIYPRDEPGAAVIVVKDGTVLLRKGYGLAQVELGVQEVDAQVRKKCTFHFVENVDQVLKLALGRRRRK